MEDTEKRLKEAFLKHFCGQVQRINMLTKLILCITKLGAINYAKLSTVLNPKVKVASNYKRIQRFMKSYKFCERSYIQFAWKLFIKKHNWVILSIDRTNWKFGKKNINILLIGISYKGTAIPLIWKLLDKQGNSNHVERKALLNLLLSHLNKDQVKQIKTIVGDREFIGYEWISYLKTLPFNFVIRIKKNSLVKKINHKNDAKKKRSAGSLFKRNRFKILHKKVLVYNHEVYIGGKSNGAGDDLILISNQPIAQGEIMYRERWGIEVFFAACKRRGFNFEDSHVTHPERLHTIIFLLGIAFVWSLKTGEKLIVETIKVPIKKIKNRKVKLFSTFRIGLDALKVKLINGLSVNAFIKLLSCT